FEWSLNEPLQVKDYLRCLPIPLFNQKKRTKQPLTSNPLKHEPSSNNSADHFNFSALLADNKALFHSRQEESTNVWKRNDFPAFGRRTEDKKLSQLNDHPSPWMKPGAMYQKSAGLPQASQRSRREEAEDWDPAASQWSAVPTARLRNLQTQDPSYTFKRSPGPQNTSKKKADHAQNNKTIQVKDSAGHLKVKEKENSLRILSAVIESMKHWSQYSNKTPLLFEVLGVLDSAVTPGQFGSKTFLLRDGKETVTCVFYEIDRELPRLIRGHVHRCMGKYDLNHKVFKCVSVRPATTAEQQTFQGFVKAADVEMCQFLKTSNEM
uniref:Spermatogenesis associated 22 n=1 Tax=Laticauda laticaudata TaxID=8630 RepID=A0A8C5RBA4_LATLA